MACKVFLGQPVHLETKDLQVTTVSMENQVTLVLEVPLALMEIQDLRVSLAPQVPEVSKEKKASAERQEKEVKQVRQVPLARALVMMPLRWLHSWVKETPKVLIL